MTVHYNILNALALHQLLLSIITEKYNMTTRHESCDSAVSKLYVRSICRRHILKPEGARWSRKLRHNTEMN
jgi:hypothetical protein